MTTATDHGRGRSVAALLISVVLLATAAVSLWLIATSGIIGGSSLRLDDNAAGVESGIDASALQAGDPVRILSNAQISQPRDPFRPLITQDSPPTGVPGVGVPGTGNGNGNGNGGFDPQDVFILVEIREVDGVLRATVTIDGTSYDVGVGDTFASVYKVVSLDIDAQTGVFMKGDKAFTAAVGQQILK